MTGPRTRVRWSMVTAVLNVCLYNKAPTVDRDCRRGDHPNRDHPRYSTRITAGQRHGRGGLGIPIGIYEARPRQPNVCADELRKKRQKMTENQLCRIRKQRK
jgi:hypothetical protein